jgi:phage recombination protein Bet
MSQQSDRNNKPGQALATIERLAPMRLPVSTGMLTQLGVTEAEYRVITDQLYPGARSVEAISLALNYCRSRNLDIMKRPCHIVPMYSSQLKRMVETVWPGIAEIRTTATRTGNYAGIDEAEFGPEIEGKFIQRIEDERDPRNNGEKVVELVYPAWCRLTVYRFVHNERCAFTARVFWKEAYATIGRNTDMPNEMWRKRTFGQLEKCTEAAALRKAFPEELGQTYAAEEMEGRTIEGEIAKELVIADAPARARPTPPPAKATATRAEPNRPAEDDIIDVVGEEIADEWGDDDNRFFEELRDDMAKAKDEAGVGEVWNHFDPMARFEGRDDDQTICVKIRNLRMRQLGVPLEQAGANQ